MKPTDRDPNFWNVSDLDAGGWGQFIAAAATFTIILIAIFLWYVTFAVAQ